MCKKRGMIIENNRQTNNINMKKIVLVVFAIVISLGINAQENLKTKTGQIKFEASTSNFEPVIATNTATSAILKTNGEIGILSLMKGFQFKKALMQKHFNSKKWVNSKEYPKTKFAGQVEEFIFDELTEEGKEYIISGKLTFHGVTKSVNPKATIKKVDGVVYLNTKFSVLVADYGINVKSKLAKKIAEKVNVEVDLELK